jgi:type I restriction enzyme S subunit
MAIRPHKIDPGFLWVCVEMQSRALSSMSKGIIPGLSREQLLAIPVPRLGERSEACVGRTSELGLAAIRHTDALIAAKREQKRGLMQQLLTGKVRFPGFTEPWKTVRLGDVAHEVSDRNKGQLAEQDVCGVIKGAGLMPMRERVMGDDLTRYLVVSPNAFAYNPMRLNIGSIAFNSSHRRVLVSPDYVVFATRPAALRPNYLNHVRSSWIWEKFVQRAGSGSVRTRIYFDDLATLKIPLPGADEQDRIDSALRGMDSEIHLLVQQREALASQRRGLMERLLSGEIDIPSSDTPAA